MARLPFDGRMRITSAYGMRTDPISGQRTRHGGLDTMHSVDDKTASQGYIVDVYDDCIMLTGMDFVGDVPVPLGVYRIET